MTAPILDKFLLISLAAFRIGALFMSLPLFTGVNIPAPLRFFLALTLAVAVSPFQTSAASILSESNDLFILSVGREILLGVMMGFSIRIVLSTLQFALEFMGVQVGFGVAGLIDPQNQEQVSVLGQLGSVLGILFFFAAGLDQQIFYVLLKSFDTMPVGEAWGSFFSIKSMVEYLTVSFELAFRLSLPVVAALFILHALLGILSKAAPQMNLFFNINFMVNLLVGILLLLGMWPQFFFKLEEFARQVIADGYGLW